jgi:hypothetical protein
MNHLEQLVAEWLQYNGYFVRLSVQVGGRARGGYEGELMWSLSISQLITFYMLSAR